MRIGVDVLALGELDRLHTRRWFGQYTYADEELALAGSLSPGRAREFLAGRFAAKEAVLKVLGTGFSSGVRPAQVCVLPGELSAPTVRLSGAAAQRAKALGVGPVAVSIAHKKEQVIAVAIAGASPTDISRAAGTVLRKIIRSPTGIGKRGTAMSEENTALDTKEAAPEGNSAASAAAPEEITATLRVRMNQQDAYYGGDLVDGARLLRLFGDLVTEITIRSDGDEGLLTGYRDVAFLAPVHPGDYVEASARLVGRSRLRRTVEFTAYRTVSSRYELGPSRAEADTEPVLVCRATGTAVVPPAAARRAGRARPGPSATLSHAPAETSPSGE